MQSPEKPKRRMVVYITEETYAQLQEIAGFENRSVSNVAERKILVGLRAGPDRTGPDLTENAPTRPDRTGKKPEDLKTSVINVLDNLPAESLVHLAEKLSRILDNSVPVQTGQDQNEPVVSGSNVENLHSDYVTEKQKKIIEIATRLSDFVQKNKFSQRSFRKTYGIDITNLRFWVTGERGMSFMMMDKLEIILSSSPMPA